MIKDICAKAKEASRILAQLSTEEKNKILSRLIDSLNKNKELIYNENQKDIDKAKEKGLNEAIIQRLKIDDKVFDEMIGGIKTIISLDDPIGEVIEERKIIQDMILRKVRVPLGVVLIIYESRPNVTINVSAICIKSGNAVILKGGSDALNSNKALFNCVKEALGNNGIILIDQPGHEIVTELLKMNEYIDVAIPRGGKRLIQKVVENARMPVIKHFEGVCAVYVDRDADIDKAVKVTLNAKV